MPNNDESDSHANRLEKWSVYPHMLHWLGDFSQDLRYAARLLKNSPGFTITAIAMLALGIGANTAVFSIIHGTLLRPLPYRDPSRLVAVWDHSLREAGLAKTFASYKDYADFVQHSHSFDQLAAATWAQGSQVTMTGRGPARGVLALPVSTNFFDLLGVAPALGRTFSRSDRNQGCSVVLANSFWTEALGSGRRIVGDTLNLGQRPCRVLGVMPPGFSFYPSAASMWSLITPDFVPPPDKLFVGIFGRLKPGVSPASAQAELRTLHDALHHADGQERGMAPAVYDLQGEFTWLAGRNLRATLWILLGAVAMVLFIACFNVANMLLGRSVARARELAVRAALGGGRARLLRQLLTEGLLLSLAGGVLGIAAAFAALHYFRAVNPIDMPVGAEIGISVPVLWFTLALACLTALIFGFAPAWRASGVSLSEALKRGGRGAVPGSGRSHLAMVLVTGEVALSVVLLAGAALLIQSVARMGSTPLGFQPDGLLTAGITLPSNGYSDAEQRLRLYQDLESRFSALPGVRSAALGTSLPPYSGASQALEILGRPPVPRDAVRHDVGSVVITPQYFQTLGITLLRGRLFNQHDRANSEPVAIVDEALAREYFPHADPIGRRVRIEDQQESQAWATVVGVVTSERRLIVYQEMNWIEPATLFRPLAQDTRRAVSLALRTTGGDTQLGVAIRREVAAIDPEIIVGRIETLRQKITAYLAYPRFRALLLGAFAGLALLLAAVGLHGVLSQFTSQRTREIGVRMALGARPADVMRMIARHGGVAVLAGLGLGLASAGMLGKLLAGLLYSVEPHDPLTLATISLTLLLTAVIAISLPAWRASRTDPMAALREE